MLYQMNISIFADDTKLYSSVPADMQSSINSMTEWLGTHKLKLAPHKCYILNINKPSVVNDSQYFINNTAVVSKSVMKDLGVFISQDLKWAAHINYIYNNASSVSYHILKSFKSKNIYLLKKTFSHLYTPQTRV